MIQPVKHITEATYVRRNGIRKGKLKRRCILNFSSIGGQKKYVKKRRIYERSTEKSK